MLEIDKVNDVLSLSGYTPFTMMEHLSTELHKLTDTHRSSMVGHFLIFNANEINARDCSVVKGVGRSTERERDDTIMM